jgi:hypothetical protein
MRHYLELKCGSPNDNTASFSRFVLPFAYHLQPSQHSGLYYQKTTANNDKQRKKYLTNETALVLFERATWFEINPDWQETPWGKKTITVKLKTGEFEIKMLPPRLVLFEFPKNPKVQQKNSVLHTGFLYVDIYFTEQDKKPILDDLMQFNELFRYFDMPYEYHIHDYKECLKNIPIDYPIYTNNEYQTLCQETDNHALYFSRWFNLLNIPIQHNNEYYSLIPTKWENKARKWIYNADVQKTSETENCLIHVDNRCYVWTAGFIEGGGKILKSLFDTTSSSPLQAHHFGHWVKFLNIDSPPYTPEGKIHQPEKTHEDISEFEKKWAKERTYKRWQHSGTWYGFNYHSGVMLDDTHNTQTHLCRVFREQYFDQTLLLLYLRTTLFHFSRNLSLIIHEKEDVDLEKIRVLRKDFSRFAILYQFPSLSNQQQAIEMYALARKHLDIDELYKEVQEEINNAHDFMEQEESNKLSNAAHTLAKWGVPIGGASVAATLMTVYKVEDLEKYLTGFQCQFLNCPFWRHLWGDFSFQLSVVVSVFIVAVFLIRNKR